MPVAYIGWDVGHMLGHMLGHVIITGTICDHHRHYMLHMHALYVTYARLIWTFDWACDHHRHYTLHMHALYAWFSNEQQPGRFCLSVCVSVCVCVCLYAVGRFEIATCTPCMCALCV